MKNGEWNTGGIKLKDITNQCTFSWATAPTQITAGAFPDSFIDGNHETKLEFFGTHAGAGTQARLHVSLPKICTFMFIDDVGLGAQIGGDGSAVREVYSDISIYAERYPSQPNMYRRTPSNNVFLKRLKKTYQGFSQDYGDCVRLMFYANTAGDWAWEIFSIRIIEVVGV